MAVIYMDKPKPVSSFIKHLGMLNGLCPVPREEDCLISSICFYSLYCYHSLVNERRFPKSKKF